MYSFPYCLYRAHCFTAPKGCFYNLDYVCCTPDTIYGADGKKLYAGNPIDYPWQEMHCNAPGNSMIFLTPISGCLKKSLAKCGYELREGKLYALGVMWKICSNIIYPSFQQLLLPLKDMSFYPVAASEWKSLVKFRKLSSSNGRDCLVSIRQERRSIVAKIKNTSQQFVLSENVSEDTKHIIFDLSLWPKLCESPIEIALDDQSLLLRREREEMILLGIKL